MGFSYFYCVLFELIVQLLSTVEWQDLTHKPEIFCLVKRDCKGPRVGSKKTITISEWDKMVALTRLVPIKVGRSRDILHYTLKVEPTEFLTVRVPGKRATEQSSITPRLLVWAIERMELLSTRMRKTGWTGAWGEDGKLSLEWAWDFFRHPSEEESWFCKEC